MIVAILAQLKDTMHVISAGLLIPVILVLMLFLAFTVFELGSLLVESLTERRGAKLKISEMIDSFQGKGPEEILEIVDKSCLLRRQKAALDELIKYNDLPEGSLQAMARRLLAGEELHYERITARTDLIARLGPMFGLMSTLIPLGPGLIALGQGDTKTLADSLLTAFDATVFGLATAGVAFVISRMRKRWYEDLLGSTEALMESLLEVFACEQGTEKQTAKSA
ncbi:MotA/TolQ/ExbB proton channel family protein [Petroclostridium sp. X23]|uniref:MotA/TolQ/ExbB proton channel family protein n=1 Tax=Petroclostridium sp. X23 TaxID=3045146 RepID=UPI0024ACA06F|nr:MotA/TolQ/ExbB proton channel family protein [Petroclostridium sp. X23]WHH57769.1 MotA/TolQ/ExbB proton channel family protein [Petroclostridium sp. X23]